MWLPKEERRMLMFYAACDPVLTGTVKKSRRSGIQTLARVHMLSTEEKQQLTKKLVEALSGESEVCRIIVFGSFLYSDSPLDLDVAVFQDSDEKYLPLALKYRRKTREIARMIPLDIIPLRAGVRDGAFMDEIEQGEVIYER